MNTVLWNSEMTLSIGLRSEMDKEIFIKAALCLHIELSGDKLERNEYQISMDQRIYMLEVI